MIDVIWLDYKENNGYWSQAMLKDMFSGDKFVQHRGIGIADDFKADSGAIIIFHAQDNEGKLERLQSDINKFPWVVLVITGEVTANFPYGKLEHPNMRTWVMSPQDDFINGAETSVRLIPCGYTPKLASLASYKDKEIDWIYDGQVNNERREQMSEQLRNLRDTSGLNCEFMPTAGFSMGHPQTEYYDKMSNSKIAICPSGVTLDTFRMFEALELGCIPIVDEQLPGKELPPGYWGWFFKDQVPFPVVSNYEGLPSYIREWLVDWKAKSNRIYAWWQRYKRNLKLNILSDVKAVSGIDTTEDVTIIIPTSTIPSHPDTAMIEKAVLDARTKLPNSEIIITFDGLTNHFAGRKDVYDEYIRRVLWKANFEWHNVFPIIFDKPTHQVGMARVALDHVKTPTILYVEHDTSICADIDFGYSWDELVKTILSGEANVIRFHHEAYILPTSKHLMIGDVEPVNGVPMVRTMEWSQRPHLARTKFYKEMLANNFSPNTYGMIEDHIFGQVIADCKDNGLMGWYSWRLWIFHPTDGNIKRSYTLDGRKDDPKHDEDYKY